MTKYFYEATDHVTGQSRTRKSVRNDYMFSVLYFKGDKLFDATFHSRRDLAETALHSRRWIADRTTIVEVVPKAIPTKTGRRMKDAVLPAELDYRGVKFTKDLYSPLETKIFRIAGLYRGKLLWVETTGKYFRGSWKSLLCTECAPDANDPCINWAGAMGYTKKNADLFKVIEDLQAQVDHEIDE